MAYARKSEDDSDVHVYAHVQGGVASFICCSCPGATTPHTDHHADTPREMVEHLIEDARAGHLVPEEAVLALIADQLSLEARQVKSVRRAGGRPVPTGA